MMHGRCRCHVWVWSKMMDKRQDRFGKFAPELCKIIQFFSKTKQHVATPRKTASSLLFKVTARLLSHCNKELN